MSEVVSADNFEAISVGWIIIIPYCRFPHNDQRPISILTLPRGQSWSWTTYYGCHKNEEHYLGRCIVSIETSALHRRALLRLRSILRQSLDSQSLLAHVPGQQYPTPDSNPLRMRHRLDHLPSMYITINQGF